MEIKADSLANNRWRQPDQEFAMRAMTILFIVALVAIFGWQNRNIWIPNVSTTQNTESNISDNPNIKNESIFDNKPKSPTASDIKKAELSIEEEAATFIDTLVESSIGPIQVEHMDHFITGQQTIALLPKDIIQITSIEKILKDSSLAPNSPITLVRELPQIELITPARLIAESGGDLNQLVLVVDGNTEENKTVREILNEYSGNPEALISIIRNVRYFEISTPAELKSSIDLSAQGGKLIGIIKRPYQLEKATIADLLEPETPLDPNSILYVRTVTSTDIQGIWGIVQNGVVSNFARGIAVKRGQNIDTYKVEIPPLADEILPNKHSSFLGQLIDKKTKQSYVYNFRKNRMGKNANNVIPGQEIVIIQFTPDELIRIYKHFVGETT